MNKWILLVCLAAGAYSWKGRDASPERTTAYHGEDGEFVETIVSDGSDVDLADFLEPGVRTVFEYTADW